ncbi:MAG: hypothetical protein R2764_08700 [Bacteroidales bacterium]
MENGFEFWEGINNCRASFKGYGKVPKDHFFLETDDSEATIEDIYTAAAELRELSVLDIQQIIKSNFNKCFRIDVE